MRPAAVCLDVDGTLTDGVRGPALPGAVEAVQALRAKLPLRLVTNTTSVPHAELAQALIGQGLLDTPDSLWTPVLVARRELPARGHDSGVLIADSGQREEYAWFREDAHGPAVLLATEAHGWRVADLQPAFRRLLEGAAFYALTRNRYFRKEGVLVTDIGGVAALLSYASGREAETLGKPSRLLFEAVARHAGVALSEMVMVGDDAEFDVAAPIALGMAGVLVKTGKFRPGDESRAKPAPTAVLDSIGDLPRWLSL
ncbi:MAG TPA: HAD hydrolase-like protein [Candidatus Limnocylindrales bacterium]|nr:HAD hydrolase-like protein [Candidatus Limnocylindrales bacterium]